MLGAFSLKSPKGGKIMKKSNVHKTVKIGVLAAIAYLLQMLGSFMGLKVAGFLEIEFSDLPALIGALALGPASGVLIELIKNLLHTLSTSTGFVGEFANFVVNSSMVLTAGLIYRIYHSRRGAIAGMSAGVLLMTIAGIAVNLYIMLPLYMPDSDFGFRLTLALSTIAPFNLCRGAVLSFITFLCYKKLRAVFPL